MTDCNQPIPGVNTSDIYICAICGQPLDAKQQGTKPQRINGAVEFTDSVTILTCWTNGCAAWGITTTPGNYYDQLRAHKVLSNKPIIDRIMHDWLRELATTREFVK